MALHLPGRRKVLVVDDNADAAGTLAMLLRQLGHEVEVALDGPDAIAVARRMRPDFVLLDIGLPGIDGFRVAETLKKEPGLERLFIVAVTALATDEDRRRSSEAGIDVHLVKPADPRFIVSLVGDAR